MRLTAREAGERVGKTRQAIRAATTVVMDTITGAVSSDRAPLFASIVIAAPLTPELAVAA